jgi:hypothetical protein
MYRLKTDAWYLERLLFTMGGIMTLFSVIMVLVHSIYWLILTALVGLNLLVFGVTGFCITANLFYKLGAKPRLGR